MIRLQLDIQHIPIFQQGKMSPSRTTKVTNNHCDWGSIFNKLSSLLNNHPQKASLSISLWLMNSDAWLLTFINNSISAHFTLMQHDVSTVELAILVYCYQMPAVSFMVLNIYMLFCIWGKKITYCSIYPCS